MAPSPHNKVAPVAYHHIANPPELLEEYEGAYGIRFSAATDSQTNTLFNMAERLADKREALERSGLYDRLGILPTKQAVLYVPQAYLARPLTESQVRAINEVETGKVAAYATGVQRHLAQVPIVESGERMAHLPSLFAEHQIPATFSDTPFHAACGEWAGKPREFWAREAFAKRLVVMGSILQEVNSQLHVDDAFRPVGVQEGLFKRRVAWTKRDHPSWSEEQIITEAQSKTAVMPRLASHKGGAALDARLRSQQNNELLDIGHEYPDGGALVFPRSPFVTFGQLLARQTFQVAANLSDLALYVGEDWHVSYGDNLASLDNYGRVQPGYVAQYGPIKDFDRTTGAITAVYGPKEMDEVFPH